MTGSSPNISICLSSVAQTSSASVDQEAECPTETEPQKVLQTDAISADALQDPAQ